MAAQAERGLVNDGNGDAPPKITQSITELILLHYPGKTACLMEQAGRQLSKFEGAK
jgi:hypothetical protein